MFGFGSVSVRRLAVGLVLGQMVAVFAGSAVSAETIYQAMGAAYSSNPTLNAQRAATRAADENLPIAKSLFRPFINASADIGLSRTVSTGAAFGTSGTTLFPDGFGVVISQGLYRGFRTINSVKAAEAGIRASRESLRNTEQNVLFDAARAFLDVLRDRALVNTRRENLSFLKEQTRAAKARLDVGEGTRTDVAQAVARRALAQSQLSASLAQRATSAAIFTQVIGHEPGKLLLPRTINAKFPANMDAAFAIAMSEHPALKATQHLVDVASFDVKVSEGALLPSLSLEGSVSQRYNTSLSINSRSSGSLIARLTIPIYQGGGEYATIRRDKETLGQRRIEVDASRDQVRTAVVSAWSQMLSARASNIATDQQVSASKLALAGVIEEREVGQRTTLDVLNAQSALLISREQSINSRRNELVAGFAVLSAIGRLNNRRLSLNVTAYKPKQHYKAVKDKWIGLRTPDGR